MKKRRFILAMLISLIAIVIFWGIHIARTNKINEQVHVLENTADANCSFSLSPQNNKEVSWTRTATINGEEIDLYACSYDGTLVNKDDIEISDWTLRLNIKCDCYLNSAWCGLVEVHQFDGNNEIVQKLDLRNAKNEKLQLKYYEDGDIYLFPMKEGDYIIYYPDMRANEVPVVSTKDKLGIVNIGLIMYWDKTREYAAPEFTLNYMNNIHYLQGAVAVIGIIISFIWFVALIAGISVIIAVKVMREKEMMRLTKENNEILNEEVKKRTRQIITIQHKVVLGLADMIENRDYSTGGHVKRTSDIVQIIIEEIYNQKLFDISREMAVDIVRAAPMHDLGKIVIDTSVLNKPGKLTDDEFEIMKNHAVKSGEIVKIILDGVEEEHFVNVAFNVARYHHERWDGKGYPEGLSGNDIPLEARLMALADVYDALVSKRCYKAALSKEEVNDIIMGNMGTVFDPSMQNIYESCRERLEDYYKLV